MDNTGTEQHLMNSPFMTKHWHDTTQSLQDNNLRVQGKIWGKSGNIKVTTWSLCTDEQRTFTLDSYLYNHHHWDVTKVYHKNAWDTIMAIQSLWKYNKIKTQR